MCQEHDKLIQILTLEKKKLEGVNGELQEEISLLKFKLERLNKSLRLLNSGTDALDDLLEASKQGKSKKGIGFDYSAVNEEGQNAEKNFVVSQSKSEFVQHTDYKKFPKKSQHPIKHVDSQVRGLKQTTWICHYCGRYGHLRPYCYKLHGYPRMLPKSQVPKVKNHKKREWKDKNEVSALIAHTSLRVSSKEDWYFDSGCS